MTCPASGIFVLIFIINQPYNGGSLSPKVHYAVYMHVTITQNMCNSTPVTSREIATGGFIFVTAFYLGHCTTRFLAGITSAIDDKNSYSC